MRALFLFVPILSAVATTVHAEFLRVTGTTGYLSEWEVSGSVTELTSGHIREFSGPLIMRHTGLCSQDGPEEKVAQITFQIKRMSPLSQFRATMTMDGDKCTFGGRLSDPYSGVMDCANARGVPLTLTIK